MLEKGFSYFNLKSCKIKNEQYYALIIFLDNYSSMIADAVKNNEEIDIKIINLKLKCLLNDYWISINKRNLFSILIDKVKKIIDIIK